MTESAQSIKLDAESTSYVYLFSEFMGEESINTFFGRMYQYALAYCTHFKIDFMSGNPGVLEHLTNKYAHKYAKYMLHKFAADCKGSQNVGIDFSQPPEWTNLRFYGFSEMTHQEAYEEWRQNEVGEIKK